MMTTFTAPLATMVGSQSFSLVGLSSPVTDLSWLAPVALAAAVWTVVLVARATVRDRAARAERAATAPAELRQAA
jgi:hypothetical protein